MGLSRAKGKGQRAKGRGQRALSCRDSAEIATIGAAFSKSFDNQTIIHSTASEATTCISKSIICDRSFEFASRALTLCDRLWDRGPSARQLASQLISSATSIGSNAEEAQEGQTKRDFIAKMSISRKEARESLWWLRLIAKNRIASEKEVEWELSEAKQLLAMIRSAIITARSRPDRGESRTS